MERARGESVAAGTEREAPHRLGVVAGLPQLALVAAVLTASVSRSGDQATAIASTSGYVATSSPPTGATARGPTAPLSQRIVEPVASLVAVSNVATEPSRLDSRLVC